MFVESFSYRDQQEGDFVRLESIATEKPNPLVAVAKIFKICKGLKNVDVTSRIVRSIKIRRLFVERKNAESSRCQKNRVRLPVLDFKLIWKLQMFLDLGIGLPLSFRLKNC